MAARRVKPPQHVAVASLADTGDPATDRVMIQAEQNLQDLQDQLRTAQASLVGVLGITRRWTTGTAPPTTGAHERAEIVWNTAPTPGGFIGWVCTAAGTPGTWRTFGPIS